jgi:hypothetical protein
MVLSEPLVNVSVRQAYMSEPQIDFAGVGISRGLSALNSIASVVQSLFQVHGLSFRIRGFENPAILEGFLMFRRMAAVGGTLHDCQAVRQ